ncbi:unnamed protein product [Hyaloperonospora brassicae]|uniref:Rab-GAP TBC domain-containing protein n=1 Tax=Hyaloperonospora brassicae TaxID=162125 RepID=A0AAV0UXZ2_HYABA|nr:unnamed protein product [Hyaloperonospora brassicae]
MIRKRLCVEVVSARNLESSQSIDSYCVVGLCAIESMSWRGNCRLATSSGLRSSTVTGSSHPTWAHVTEFVLPAPLANVRLRVELRSAKNFFFDMFPPSDDGRRLMDEKEAAAAQICGQSACFQSDQSNFRTTSEPQNCVKGLKRAQDSDSDDVATLSEEEEEEDDDDESYEEDGTCTEVEEDTTVAAAHSDDEVLGVVEINPSVFCKSSGAVTDSWYILSGTRTGEVRIRTIWYTRAKRALAAQDRAVLYEEHVQHCVTEPMNDFYGFSIPMAARDKWVHLRSYQDCREERRVEDWTRLYGAEFAERLRRCSFKERDTKEKALLMQLARNGIPRHMRARAYVNLSGASEKQKHAGADYYMDLVKKAETVETETFSQIELDIGRTFGQSETIISSESGRGQLRRILRAYSLRNSSIGYCQGLNFIVAFLLLIADEEVVFWLLSVFCEDLYPGYYCPAMDGIQRDMLVLKQMIAEELPELDKFASEMGLPLELLGSQWLLCLFTTTFPSETVFRIFDCIFIEGSTFVFPVIMAHLRRLEPTLLDLDEFHGVLSSIKDAESACVDGDTFMTAVCKEAESVSASRVRRLREAQHGLVRSEMERAERARSFNKQLAIVHQIPAFPHYAACLLRFFHEEAEESSRSDVAFVLTMLCHGLVWLAEQSKRWSY